MGRPIFKDCCCLELRWGALIVAIVDILLSLSVGGGDHFTGTAMIFWVLCIVIHVAHFVAVVVVKFSVFQPNKKLVIPYLITGILRLLVDIPFLIYLLVKYPFENGVMITDVLLIISIIFGIYFWIIIYSWYQSL